MHHASRIGLLHPTGANDVLSFTLYVRDFFFLSRITQALTTGKGLAAPPVEDHRTNSAMVNAAPKFGSMFVFDSRRLASSFCVAGHEVMSCRVSIRSL